MMDTQMVLLGGLSDDLLLGCDGCDPVSGLGSPFSMAGARGTLTPQQAAVVASPNPLARVTEAQKRANELAAKNRKAAASYTQAAATLSREGKGGLAQQAAHSALQATADATRYAAAARGYEGAKKLAASAESAARSGNTKAATGFRAGLGTMLAAVAKAISTPIAAGAGGARPVTQNGSPVLPNAQATRVPPGIPALALAKAAGMGFRPPEALARGTNQPHVAGPVPGLFNNPNAGSSVRSVTPRQAGYNPQTRLNPQGKAALRAQGIGGLGGLGADDRNKLTQFTDWLGKTVKDPKAGLLDAAQGVKNTVTKVAEQAIGGGAAAAGQQIAQAVAPPASQASTANSVTQQIVGSSLPGADGGIGAGIPGGTTTLVLGGLTLAGVGYLLTRKRGGLNGYDYGMGAAFNWTPQGTTGWVATGAAVLGLAWWWKKQKAAKEAEQVKNDLMAAAQSVNSSVSVNVR